MFFRCGAEAAAAFSAEKSLSCRKIAAPYPASASSCPFCFSLRPGVIDLPNRPDYATSRFDTGYVLTTATSYLGRYAYIEAGYTF